MNTTITTPHTTVRPSEDRGAADHGWLKSKHTFSFAGYHDPKHMGFRSLRVINQDRVAPGAGFPLHPHRDMEIFSYVLDGKLKHEDSMGNSRILEPGEIQLMSAGKGVAHSEYNPSPSEGLHFLQIWVEPSKIGLEPTYTEWRPPSGLSEENKMLVISPDGRNGSAFIHQDAEVYRLCLQPGELVTHELREGRGVWMQVIHGPVGLNETELASGDAGSSETAGLFQIQAQDQAVEALLFDLA
ncbi:MAG: pirin family protein [Verrucomicrobiota bacterium]